MGKGIRIAIIDSGIDKTHPDLSPNLALNLTEVDQTAYPSACDDGTPQDQQGHGTWTASLAAGALGPGTGKIIGVAPAATILNIKVLQRMPASITGDTNPADQCEAGEASGLLSWVMKGIEDAVTNRADVISLSVGAVADLTTGDGAGLLAAFNQITYAAAQANIVLVASAGNDGIDLSNPRYVELPAQSRSVLAIAASTNAACAQNTTPGATCTAGPVSLAYYTNYGAPSTPSPHPAAAIPTAPTPASAAGFRAPAAPACPTPSTASPQTPPTATDASTWATPPTFRPWAQAPPPLWPPEPQLLSAPPTRTGAPRP
ncbi:S8 family serine peptidase [Tunturiibacter gelidiferens]